MLPLCGMQQEVCAKPVGFHHFQTTQAAPISVQNMHAFSSLTANNVGGGGGGGGGGDRRAVQLCSYILVNLCRSESSPV